MRVRPAARCSRAWMIALLGVASGCDDGTTADRPDAGSEPRTDATPAGDASGPAADASAVDMSGPATLSLRGPETLDACARQTIELDGDPGPSPEWRVTGAPWVDFEVGEGGRSLRVRAPAVARETALTVELRRTADEETPAATHTLTVRPVGEAAALAIGLAPDCAPFDSGVASGDPAADGVLLWTRVRPPADGAAVPLRWVVATDRALTDVVAEGEVTATAATDHTAQVEVTGLAPGSTWYYRFETEAGEVSTTGRTRTLPVGPVERARLAVGSCSSLFSGYFDAYAHMAERDDLDLVVHLGDFIYDFVDENEKVRVPVPEPAEPVDAAGWRDRFRLYLSDPDLRAARRSHPFFVMWDNHDLDRSSPETVRATTEVFREYVPMRRPDPAGDPAVAYRSLKLGTLAEILLVDVLLHRSPVVEDGTGDILGPAQWDFVERRLAATDTDWRILGSQKLFDTLKYPPVNLPEASDWDEYPESRRRLVEALAPHGDNVLLTGDLHFTIATDVVADPLNEASPYDPSTGVGSVGVELLAAGITRGNFDETLCDGPCGGASDRIFDNIRNMLLMLNPHARHFELLDHGYGVVELTPDAVTAEVWYTDILTPGAPEALGVTLRADRGANRWRRE